jgi:hypothetical protein
MQTKQMLMLRAAQSQSLLKNPASLASYKKRRRFYLRQARRNQCCKLKYNLSRTLCSQLRLKHKKFQLMSENLPLALDLIDKSTVNFCTNTNSANSNMMTSSANCVNCTLMLSASQNATSTVNLNRNLLFSIILSTFL